MDCRPLVRYQGSQFCDFEEGVGKRTRIDRLEIRWPEPSGQMENFTDLPIDRYVTIVEGSGLK
ncbi:MAG: hypothetical protein DMG69_24680 [Acidobacteria bacterium]|nr:MAG: hypothetical protein DMG69_24680 [Acidobacteriota bacterium]